MNWETGTEFYTYRHILEANDHFFVSPLPYGDLPLVAMSCNSQKFLSSLVFLK